MLDARKQTGLQGEARAEAVLRRKGYRILARNLRSSTGELDLVADDHGVLVFVEVKARRTPAFGGVSFAVDPRKQLRVIRQAAQYLAHHRIRNRPCRFDVVLLSDDGAGTPQVEHIRNAFEVPGDDLRW